LFKLHINLDVDDKEGVNDLKACCYATRSQQNDGEEEMYEESRMGGAKCKVQCLEDRRVHQMKVARKPHKDAVVSRRHVQIITRSSSERE